MQSDTLKALYGIEAGESFGDHYGKASIEGLLIYIVAYCTYALERMLDAVETEIEDLVNRLSPGRPDWYARQLRDYLNGVEWDMESGEFDTDGLSDDEIERRRIIKHAVAVDDSVTGQLILKIAGEEGGERVPLGAEDAAEVSAYINRIKYAGVATRLINQEGDTYNCKISIWYDPLLRAGTVEADCRTAIKDYLRNLPFNGEYSNMALIDALQQVKGVEIAEMQCCSHVIHGDTEQRDIDAKAQPYAGYFNPGDITLEMEEH